MSYIKVLEGAHVLGVEVSGSMVRFAEACDWNYSHELTPNETRQLAAELIALADAAAAEMAARSARDESAL